MADAPFQIQALVVFFVLAVRRADRSDQLVADARCAAGVGRILQCGAIDHRAIGGVVVERRQFVRRSHLAVQGGHGEVVAQIAGVLAGEQRRPGFPGGFVGEVGATLTRNIIVAIDRAIGFGDVAGTGHLDQMVVGDVPVHLGVPAFLLVVVVGEAAGAAVVGVAIGAYAHAVRIHLLGGQEEEQLVLDDGSADIGAVGGLVGFGLTGGLIQAIGRTRIAIGSVVDGAALAVRAPIDVALIGP